MLFASIALGTLIGLAVHAWPGKVIRIAAGPIGGSFYETAVEYGKIMERQGYQVEIEPFQNTDEIGEHVADSNQHFDIGFVAGDQGSRTREQLISLGDVQLQPIFIFETRRAALEHPIRSFSDMRGMNLVLPPQRSLTSRTLIDIFALNGITTANTHIEFLTLDQGIAGLKQGHFDIGLFILGADSQLMADLATNANLTMVVPDQRESLTRKLTFLREVTLPAGIFDLPHDVPPRNIGMLAATISVVARQDLPSATIYSVLGAMRQVHSQSSYINRADEFPHYSSIAGQGDPRVEDFYLKGVPWAYSHFSSGLASVIDTYLGWLLAFWVAASALNVMSDLERIRLYAMVMFARSALWWVRRQPASGGSPNVVARAMLRKIESSMAREAHGVDALLIEVRKALSV